MIAYQSINEIKRSPLHVTISIKHPVGYELLLRNLVLHRSSILPALQIPRKLQYTTQINHTLRVHIPPKGVAVRVHLFVIIVINGALG
jgi:hypothetical protein